MVALAWLAGSGCALKTFAKLQPRASEPAATGNEQRDDPYDLELAIRYAERAREQLLVPDYERARSVQLAGARAIDCAILRIRPLRIEPSTLKAFNNALDELTSTAVQQPGIYDLQQLIRSVETAEARAQDFGGAGHLVSVSEATRRTARQLLHDAERAMVTGASLNRQLYTAAPTLRSTVDTVMGEVDAQVVRGEPSLDRVTAVVSRLDVRRYPDRRLREQARPAGRSARDAVPAQDAPGVGKATGAQSALAEAVIALEKRVGYWRARVSIVTSLVDGVEAASWHAARQPWCERPGSVARLIVQPPGPHRLDAGSRSRGFLISGGTPPYSVEPLDEFVPGLTVSMPDLYGPHVVVSVEPRDVPPGEHLLVVRDAAGRAMTTRVRVEIDNAAPVPDKAVGPEEKRPRKPRDEEVARLQELLAKLGFEPGPADGRRGPRTEAAIAELRAALGSRLPLDVIPAGDLYGMLREHARDLENLTPEGLYWITVERWLEKKGFNPGDINGLAGGKLQEALESYFGEHHPDREPPRVEDGRSPELLELMRKDGDPVELVLR